MDVLLRRAESKELLMGVLVEELFEKRDLAVAAKMLELITSANSSVRPCERWRRRAPAGSRHQPRRFPPFLYFGAALIYISTFFRM